MNIRNRIQIATLIALGSLGISLKSHAQSMVPHLNYLVIDTNDCYQPLYGGHIINADDFLNSSGEPDHDNGTVDSIPVGFTFDYNGVVCNSVNINVNGWVSVNPVGSADSIPSANTQSGSDLFSEQSPNNTLAPYWGDHFYRTVETGYTPSSISYEIEYVPISIDPGSPPFTQVGVFIVEWKNLNVNEKSDPNSLATFQLIIYQNRKAYDDIAPDERATIEFRYGPADSLALVAGAAIGIEDSTGLAHLNGLFESSQFNGDSSKYSTARTSCWPPPACTASPCTAIEFIPTGELAEVSSRTASVNMSVRAYPNPFGGSANIIVSSKAGGATEIGILNLLGAEVARVYDGELSAGEHTFTWDAHDAAPGMYECVVRSAGHIQETPILLTR